MKESKMRLAEIRRYLEKRGWQYQYSEENECGSIDFEHRGLSFHIWEFYEDGYGAESNLKNVGRMEDYGEHYEEELLAIMQEW